MTDSKLSVLAWWIECHNLVELQAAILRTKVIACKIVLCGTILYQQLNLPETLDERKHGRTNGKMATRCPDINYLCCNAVEFKAA